MGSFGGLLLAHIHALSDQRRARGARGAAEQTGNRSDNRSSI